MSKQTTLTEIFMSKAQERMAYYKEFSKAINVAENAIDGSEWLRKWRSTEDDVRTWSAVSAVANDMIQAKCLRNEFSSQFQDYLAHAERIVRGTTKKTDCQTLQELQFEKNQQKLEANANVIGFEVAVQHLTQKRDGEISEKDLKAAFRALDRYNKRYQNHGALGQYVLAQRDDIVREVRDIAIASRREFKLQQLALIAA